MSKVSTPAKWKTLASYFVLAYGITWVFALVGADRLWPFQIPAALRTSGRILLHYGPALAALVVTAYVGGKAGVRALLAGLGKWRVGLHWYLIALLLPTILRLAAVSLDVLSGGSWPDFFHASAVPPGNPLILIVPVFLAVLFQAGLAEEIGWRGYALPQLQTRYSALTASLILGILHGPWHFRPESMSILAPVILPWWLLVIAMSIIWTWLYNNTQGSLLLAVLFHTASDVSDWIVPTLPGLTAATSNKPFIILAGLLWIVAVGIILIFGPRTFVRKPQPPQK